MTDTQAIEVARPLSPAEISWKVAQKIANTPFVPTAFRGKPESVYAAVLYGEELGLGPMQSLTQIHVIEGKPSLAPEGMRGLVLKAGHRIDVKIASNDKVVLYGKRADSGSEATVEWTMKDAQLAGLAGRGAWKTYPRAMLMARATSELCRMLFADIIAGLSYTPEEAASIAGVEWSETPAPTPTPALATFEPAPVADIVDTIDEALAYEPEVPMVKEAPMTVAEVQEIFDAEIVDNEFQVRPEDAATGKQINMIRAIGKGVGLGHDDLKGVASGLLGREINVLAGITKREASQIIDHLKAMPVVAS